jgi:succinate dehydrogenase / fumarate reductase membrane anchor subunit
MSMVHPLAKVLGYGTAKSGVHHWWVQRVTAIALLPLTLWVVWSLLALNGADYDTVTGWMQDPLHAALLLIWVTVMLHHAQIGLQVVIEDYVHGWLEMASQIAVKFIFTLGIVIAVLGVLRIVL